MKHYLSIDFESWAYPNLPDYLKLSSYERKQVDGGFVRDSADEILKILRKHQVKLTFFIMGQLYDWYPRSIESIAEDGHEIAYHTHTHDILYSGKDLVSTLKRSGKFLKKFKPSGFRAPQILIKKDYYRVLKEFGFRYSSSTYGSYEDRQQISGVWEIPVSKIACFPIGSGYFTATLGKKIGYLYRWYQSKNIPMVSFLHNWQITKPKKAAFPNQKYLLKNPHYLPYTWEIKSVFENLLRNFDFQPTAQLLKSIDR